MHMDVRLSWVAFEEQESNLGLNHMPIAFQLCILGQLIYFSFTWFSHLENESLVSFLAHELWLVQNGLIKLKDCGYRCL